MKKFLTAAAACMLCGSVYAGDVPPDYPAQVNAPNTLDQQIERIHLNYEDVRAKQEARLKAQRAAEAKEEARRAANARAAAAERAKKNAKIEERRDESAELDLELKRLKVREAQSNLRVIERTNEERAKRAGDAVDADIESRRAEAQMRRTEREAIRVERSSRD